MRKLAALLLFLFTAGAQAQLSLDADISPRAEVRHGYRVLPNPDDRAAGHVNQRSRLGLNWSNDNLRTRFAIQDVRVWGQEPQRQQIPSVSLHEAWAELMFNENTFLKIGRQEVQYDNQRFFAINDWIPMGQKHDLALFKVETDRNRLHAGVAFNQEWSAYDRTFETEYRINNYKYMSYIWYNFDVGDDGKVSLLQISDGYQDVSDPRVMHVRGTWSAYSSINIGVLDLMLNPAFQHGNTSAGADIRAWYLRTEIGGSFSENSKTTTGIEIMSGNKPGNTTYGMFNPTHGAGHKFNGYMDYFTNHPVHTRNAGLINPFLKNRFEVSPLTTFEADLHLFFIQKEFYHFGTPINRYLGTEVDLTLTYRFNDFTRIIGGFSWMFGSESMEIIRGGSSTEPAYFVYIMLRIRPSLW